MPTVGCKSRLSGRLCNPSQGCDELLRSRPKFVILVTVVAVTTAGTPRTQRAIPCSTPLPPPTRAPPPPLEAPGAELPPITDPTGRAVPRRRPPAGPAARGVSAGLAGAALVAVLATGCFPTGPVETWVPDFNNDGRISADEVDHHKADIVNRVVAAVEDQRRATQRHPFLTCVRHHESDRGAYPHINGYGAQNPYSSASGAYQFIDSTWRNVSARCRSRRLRPRRHCARGTSRTPSRCGCTTTVVAPPGPAPAAEPTRSHRTCPPRAGLRAGPWRVRARAVRPRCPPAAPMP